MKKIFVVTREHWIDTQESAESSKVRPVACFSTHKQAEEYISSKMEDYPANMVFNGDDGKYYEDSICEYDSYEIFETDLDEVIYKEEA